MSATDPSRLVLAARASTARRSAIREIFDRANAMEDVIRLEIGEPSFLTPAHIRAGAREAADAGFTRYTPNGGFASLRELIVDKLAISQIVVLLQEYLLSSIGVPSIGKLEMKHGLGLNFAVN